MAVSGLVFGPIQDGPDPAIDQGEGFLVPDPTKFLMLGHPQLGADGQIDLPLGAFRQIVAGDLAPAVGGRLDKRIAPAKYQVRKPGLFQDLAPGRGEQILARLDLALGEVPIAKAT